MCQACAALSDLTCPSSSLSPAAADSFSSSILTSSATVQDSVCPLSSASSVSQDNRGGDRCKPLNSQTVLFSWNTHSNPEMFKLSSADLSHAAVVNRFWLFGGNERSLRFIERCIRSFPNFCLLGLEGTPDQPHSEDSGEGLFLLLLAPGGFRQSLTEASSLYSLSHLYLAPPVRAPILFFRGPQPLELASPQPLP